jgi:N-dimethylarginine dimethylaminohydrolase
MGEGWQARMATHADEVGTLWGDFGVRSHYAPLRAVMLAEPGEEQNYPEDPRDWLMTARPDLPLLRAQTDALEAVYGAEGVTVHRHRPARTPPPNHLFQCDLYFVTPEGAILARMAARQRAGEERGAAEGLARIGVPILHTVRGTGTFEGADAMWLDDHTVLVAVGRRTNAEGYRQVAAVLAEQGVTARAVEIGAGVQHLLGAVVLIDHDLAAVLSAEASPSLRAALAGVELVELPSDEETVSRRAMNFVPICPRRVVMPANAPRTRARLAAAGVTCIEVEVSEYIAADGAVGCLTGVLKRG